MSRARAVIDAPPGKLAYLRRLEAEVRALEFDAADVVAEWHRIARPDQRLPEGPWRVFYLQGGRGSGKTKAGAGGLTELIMADRGQPGQYGIVAPTYRDAWTVCVEGESGLLAALGTTAGEVKHGRSATVEYAYRSYGELGLRNGHVVYVDSADDGALRVQGKNLRAVWCAEIGLWQRWQTAWDESIKFAVRKGASKIICDGTPKVSRPARALIRRILRGDEPGAVVHRLRTIDNISNLSQEFYDSVIGTAKGTRLERQELEGELLDDVANALWPRELLDRIRVPPVGAEGGPAALLGCFIGVDPSDGGEDSDEQAYTVVGRGHGDPHLYVARCWGGQEAPAPFARRVIREAVTWGATVVVEKNHGGAWLREVFKQAQKDMGTAVRVVEVYASQAKRTRAEPVSLLYDRYAGDGRPLVLHCHAPREHGGGWLMDDDMAELEDQMASFTGAAGERSPDRLDSLVWAMSKFLRLSTAAGGGRGARQWAAAKELEAAGAPPDAGMRRRLAGAHGGKLSEGVPAWEDLDEWAPRETDPDRPVRGRGNVRPWA